MSNHPKIDYHKDVVVSALYGLLDCGITLLTVGYVQPHTRMKYAARDVRRKFAQQRQFLEEASNAL